MNHTEPISEATAATQPKMASGSVESARSRTSCSDKSLRRGSDAPFGRGLLRLRTTGPPTNSSQMSVVQAPGDSSPRPSSRIPPALVTFTALSRCIQSDGSTGLQQAGGHRGSFEPAGPVLYKKVGHREREFYVNAARVVPWLCNFLPNYYPNLDTGDDILPIENLVHGMHYPCVLDLKIGTSTVEDDEASFRKRIRMGALDHVTTTKSDGVRLEGMSLFRVLEQSYVRTSKFQSHAISASVGNTLTDVLAFFLTDEIGFRKDVAARFRSNIEMLLNLFENKNQTCRFIGSSILLIYDNDNHAPYSRWARALETLTRLNGNDLYRLRRKTKLAVRLIDFAHNSTLPPGEDKDAGVIKGLKSILTALTNLLSIGDHKVFSFEDAVLDAEEHSRSVEDEGDTVVQIHS